MLTWNDQNHMQHSASSSKTEGNRKGISCLRQELPKGILQGVSIVWEAEYPLSNISFESESLDT